MKKTYLVFIAVVAVSVITISIGYTQRQTLRDWWGQRNQEPVPTAVSYNAVANSNKITENTETATEDTEENIENTETEKDIEIPNQINLAIPFTSQAPKANWDALHEEACEEASVLMAARFLQNRSIADSDDAEEAIQTLTSYVANDLHYPVDLTAEQMVELIEKYYELHAEVVYDWTWDDVKKALAQGYPVLVPAAGRMLGNPNYTAPGPVYHVLVIKGYTANKVITNDSGTRKGADYQYSFDTVANASHDWNDGDVANGKKVMIIVKP